jgi:hypothetical protein
VKAATPARSAAVAGIVPWRHDLAGCLHACMATLLAFHGVQPLEALGAGWGFHYRPGDVRREEYYFPCRPGVSLLQSLAPYHPVRSRWHQPRSAGEGWEQVRDRLAAGQPVAVAVDNYHLPFRPAYHDVHSNHLVVVHGFDQERDTVLVLDQVPPSFDGAISGAVLAAARGSGNPARHERDMFFTDNPIAHRWLDVEVTAAHLPAFGAAAVGDALERNLRGFERDAPPAYEGLAGQARFLRHMTERLAAGEDVADELFVVAGAVLAVTALHADYLAMAGARLRLPWLLELGREVERVAHHWTAVRIIAARSRGRPGGADSLRRRAAALGADHERALAGVESAVRQLRPAGEARRAR